MRRPPLAPLLAVAALAGCGTAAAPPDSAPPADAAVAADLAPLDGPPGDAARPCARVPGDPDRPRKVVVSHPFTEAGEKGTAFEVLDLSPDGTLTRPGVTFQMGTALDRPIRFTPDGALGIVAQDDGSLGVVRFDQSGAPTVVHASFRMDFYAQDLAISADGMRAVVLDPDTVGNGGGLYVVQIGCDGRLTGHGITAPADNPSAIAFLDGMPGRAVLSAKGLAGAPADSDTQLIDLAAGAGSPNAPVVARAGSGTAFPDGMGIPSSVAPTPDGRFALITDNGIAVGSRVAVLALPGLKALQTLATPNPAQAVTSPFGNAALVLNSDGKDALRLLKYDSANAAAPFSIVGEVAYQNGRPQLPAAAVLITRGRLKGRVLIAENLAVRSVQFGAQGGATDVGLVTFGNGSAAIVGTIGVQP